jgi:hypothetical protein
MRRFASPLVALLLTLTVFGTSAPPASATTVQYRAEPATPQAIARMAVRDLVWKCGPGACVSSQGTSRPATECAALARKVGELKSFTVAGQPLAPEELEKCNARAR